MHLDILASVIVTATIQSLFGVGVLLFGTPLLLVLGYDFITALTILLPISMLINLLQVSKDYRHIDRRFYGKILRLTIPCIILFLFLVTRTSVSIAPLVGAFLILVAAKGWSARVSRWIESLVRYERSFFLAMGAVHGLTNLGGSLLTAMVHSQHYEKDVARATTAASYGTFAVFQILTLTATRTRFEMTFEETLLYAVAGALVFAVIEKVVYAKISTDRYRTIFAAFLFVSGVVLILKALLLR